MGKRRSGNPGRKTTDTQGANFKYEYSYEEIGRLIQKFVPAWKIEIEKYFSLVVFNFLFSNGDAHLKISLYWNPHKAITYSARLMINQYKTTCGRF